MGYYTKFDLKMKKHNNTKITDKENLQITETFIKQCSYCFQYCDLSIYLEDLISEEELKWYEHREEMKKLSSLFPNIEFTLYGVGEDLDDRWVEYYFKGEMEYYLAETYYPLPTIFEKEN